MASGPCGSGVDNQGSVMFKMACLVESSLRGLGFCVAAPSIGVGSISDLIPYTYSI